MSPESAPPHQGPSPSPLPPRRGEAVPAPIVSVVIPAYDVARFVGDAIASLRAQTLDAWEALVVDDGSRDGTAEAALAAAGGDPRLRVFRQANAGVSAARARAMAEARGEAFLFLDADDWLAPDAIERLLGALRGHAGDTSVVAAAGAAAFLPEDARPGAQARPIRVKAPGPGGDILERLLVENLFANGGQLLVRREATERVGGHFRADLRYGEDWEYWIRLALHGHFATLEGQEPVLYVRERRNSAYRTMARDPAAFAPAMDAIFGNPALSARLGPDRVAALRRRTEAENAWIAGRERLRHGDRSGGLPLLRRAVAAAPSPKRAALLAAAHLLPLLPPRIHGPFARYAG